jgi:5-methylcytosine-specific restriction endonuclease McrA
MNEDLTTREGRNGFYQSKEWRNLREHVLSINPFCLKCKAMGLLTPATCVDHIIDIAERPDLRLEITNCMSLCTPCHSRKTAKKTMKGNIPHNKIITGTIKKKYKL